MSIASAAALLALCLPFTPLQPLQDTGGEASTEEAALIRGRVLLFDGRPAAGVRVFLAGEPASEMRLAQFGSADAWSDREVDTDEEGRFHLAFEPHAALRYRLSLWRPGCALESWRWNQIGPGEEIDLGAVDLRRTGTVTGRVVDAEGRPIAEHWFVDAISDRASGGAWNRDRNVPRPETHYRRFEATGVDGVFRFEDLPEGACRFYLYLAVAGRVEGPQVEVQADEELEIELTYDGPDLMRRIHVQLDSRPVIHAYPDLDHIALRSPDGDWIRPALGPKRRSLDFDDLDDGRYGLELDDPRFEPVSLTDLRPGDGRHTVTLRGNSAVRLLVDDAESGEPLDDFRVELRLAVGTFPLSEDPWVRSPQQGGARSTGRGTRIVLHDPLREPLARSLLPGLVAGDYTLIVRTEDHAEAYVPLLELAPEETRVVEVQLERGGTLRGRLVRADGLPAGAAFRVDLFVPGEEKLQPLGRAYFGSTVPAHMLGEGYQRASLRTAVDGTFQSERIAAGTYVARVTRASRVYSTTEVVVPAGDEASVEITLSGQ